MGCSWVPSPALMTEPSIHPAVARRYGAPEAPCLTMTASAPMASRVNAVSLSDSPLETDEPLPEKVITSADNRLAANSKDSRVRVESSKKRLTTVRPRRVGNFFTERSVTDASSAVVSKIMSAWARSRSPAESRCLPSIYITDRLAIDHHVVYPVYLHETHAHRLVLGCGQVLSDEVRSDRHFAVAPIDHHCQPHDGRSS